LSEGFGLFRVTGFLGNFHLFQSSSFPCSL